MFINPRTAIAEGWITGITSDIQVQPNAIDFTLDRVFYISGRNDFVISTDKSTGKELKKMRGGDEVHAIPDRAYPDLHFFCLDAPKSYDGTSNIYLNLPENVAAQTIIRSTFNRNGIFLTSGLYDSGYKGHIGFALHNVAGYTKIEQGTRIGQIIFVRSESAGIYAGGYNHTEGTHYTKVE